MHRDACLAGDALKYAPWDWGPALMVPAAAAAELETARQLQHHVPYSLHCSFKELCAFVARLRPRAIRGIVKGSNRGGGGGQAICVADCTAAAAKHRCGRVANVAVTMASKRSLVVHWGVW